MKGPDMTDPPPEPEQAWKALTLVNDWVKHAETKSAATLAFTGVSAGVLFNLVSKQHDRGLRLNVAAAVCAAAIVLAGLSALLALMPRLSVPDVTGLLTRLRGQQTRPAVTPGEEIDETALAEQDPVNLLFFADIARTYRGDAPSFAQVLAALTTNKADLTQQIAHQVHANASVALRKYTWATRAVHFLAVGLASLALVAALVSER